MTIKIDKRGERNRRLAEYADFDFMNDDLSVK